MKFNLAQIIAHASSLSIAIPLLIYLIKIKSASKQNHIILGLIIVSGLSDLVGFILYSNRLSTATLSNIQDVLQFILLFWFYFEVFKDKNKWVFYIGIVAYLISFLTVTLFFQGFFQNQNMMWSISALILILYGIAYFYNLFTKLPVQHPYLYSSLWVNLGVLFYFSLSLWLFVMADYILNDIDVNTGREIWSYHNINNIVKNTFFAIGIYSGAKIAK